MLSGEDTNAAKQLAESLKSISTMLTAINTSDFLKQAQKMMELSKEMSTNLSKANAEIEKMQENGTIGQPVSADAKQAAEDARTQADTTAKKKGDIDAGHQKVIDRLTQQRDDLVKASAGGIDAKTQATLDRYQKHIDTATETARSGTKSAADVPQTQFAMDMQHRRANEFTIPRYGEWTVQDYFRGLSTVFEKANTMSTTQEPEQGALGTVGNMINRVMGPSTTAKLATRFQQGSELASGSVGVYRGMKNVIDRASAFTRQIGFNPTEMDTAGANLGYQRGGDLGGILPFENPLNPAMGQGLHQSINNWKLRLSHGINGQQADAITNAVAGGGFSGQLGDNLTFGLLGPQMQQFGTNPEDLMPFTSALRTGQTNVQDLATSLSNLGNTAQAASLTIGQTTEQLQEAAKAVTETGGTMVQGINFGQQFQSETGLPGGVGASALSNPFVQSIIAEETGVMPQLQGTLPTSSLISGITSSVQSLSNMYHFAPKKEYTKNFQGKIIAENTDTGQEQDNAMAAQMLGMDPASYSKLKRQLNQENAGNTINSAIAAYQQQLGSTHTRKNQIAAAQALLPSQLNTPGLDQEKVMSIDKQNNTVTMKSASGQITTQSLNATYGGSSVFGENNTGSMAGWDAIAHEEDKQNQGKTKNLSSQIMGEITQSGLWTGANAKTERESLMKISDPSKRMQQLQKDVQSKVGQINASNTPTLEVAFKGQASKYFKGQVTNPIALANQVNANQGTSSYAEANATPAGNSYLPDYSSTNTPVGDSTGGDWS